MLLAEVGLKRDEGIWHFRQAELFMNLSVFPVLSSVMCFLIQNTSLDENWPALSEVTDVSEVYCIWYDCAF